jgi:hypothetical protein
MPNRGRSPAKLKTIVVFAGFYAKARHGELRLCCHCDWNIYLSGKSSLK